MHLHRDLQQRVALLKAQGDAGIDMTGLLVDQACAFEAAVGSARGVVYSVVCTIHDDMRQSIVVVWSLCSWVHIGH